MRIFHRRKLNNCINFIHKRAFGFAYNNYESSFDELIPKDNSLKIHHGNIQKLAVEIFKVKLGIAPALLTTVAKNVYSVRYGIESASCIGPKIWNSIPRRYKKFKSSSELKAKFKTFFTENCLHKLCRRYLFHVGYAHG